jgi:hypothetical protein
MDYLILFIVAFCLIGIYFINNMVFEVRGSVDLLKEEVKVFKGNIRDIDEALYKINGSLHKIDLSLDSELRSIGSDTYSISSSVSSIELDISESQRISNDASGKLKHDLMIALEQIEKKIDSLS